MITNNGLNAIRDEFQKDLMSKVRINGNIIIESFEVSSLGDGYIEITFGIPTNVTSVSSLEILDATDKVITTNNFFVNVVPNTFFKYKINFKGGN